MKRSIRALFAALSLAVPLAAAAQAPVRIYSIVELSGGGATAGTNFDNGGEAAGITQQGNPYIFRTSFTQATAVKVENGKQVVISTLPPAGAK